MSDPNWLREIPLIVGSAVAIGQALPGIVKNKSRSSWQVLLIEVRIQSAHREQPVVPAPSIEGCMLLQLSQ